MVVSELSSDVKVVVLTVQTASASAASTAVDDLVALQKKNGMDPYEGETPQGVEATQVDKNDKSRPPHARTTHTATRSCASRSPPELSWSAIRGDHRDTAAGAADVRRPSVAAGIRVRSSPNAPPAARVLARSVSTIILTTTSSSSSWTEPSSRTAGRPSGDRLRTRPDHEFLRLPVSRAPSHRGGRPRCCGACWTSTTSSCTWLRRPRCVPPSRRSRGSARNTASSSSLGCFPRFPGTVRSPIPNHRSSTAVSSPSGPRPDRSSTSGPIGPNATLLVRPSGLWSWSPACSRTRWSATPGSGWATGTCTNARSIGEPTERSRSRALHCGSSTSPATGPTNRGNSPRTAADHGSDSPGTARCASCATNTATDSARPVIGSRPRDHSRTTTTASPGCPTVRHSPNTCAGRSTPPGSRPPTPDSTTTRSNGPPRRSRRIRSATTAVHSSAGG